VASFEFESESESEESGMSGCWYSSSEASSLSSAPEESSTCWGRDFDFFGLDLDLDLELEEEVEDVLLFFVVGSEKFDSSSEGGDGELNTSLIVPSFAFTCGLWLVYFAWIGGMSLRTVQIPHYAHALERELTSINQPQPEVCKVLRFSCEVWCRFYSNLRRKSFLAITNLLFSH